MQHLNIYLTFAGNCEEAFTFYKEIFKKEFEYIGKFKEMPPQEGMPPIDDTMGNRIMHVALPISDQYVLMGSDTMEDAKHENGNNFSLSINADSEKEATELFNKLSKGGKITMPLEKTFWNAFFGMFTDKFGINWMVNYDYPTT